MNWEIEKIKKFGASVPESDQLIIEQRIVEWMRKFKEIERNWWKDIQRRQLNNETITFYDHIALCVDVQEESKIAFVSEDHPNWDTNNYRNYSGTIEIAGWEIHYDFNIQESCVNIVFGEFQKFVKDIAKTIEKLIQLNAIRDYLKSHGGWRLYKFNECEKFKDSYEFYGYRIRNNKNEFVAGYVNYRQLKPNVWLFTDLNKFLELKHSKEGN